MVLTGEGVRTRDLLRVEHFTRLTTRTDGIANRVFPAVFAVPVKRGFDVTLAYLWHYAGARVRVVLKLYWRMFVATRFARANVGLWC